MINTIIVPLDGSPLAEQALSEARRIARTSDADIVLVRVARLRSGLHDPVAGQSVAIAEAEEYLRSKARELTDAGFGVRTDVFCHDSADGIAIAAMVHGAGLIVMSTHGRSGMRRALLGSVAERVVHQASVPVLLIRDGQPALHAGAYRTIVVPLDGSALAEGALRFVAQEPCARRAKIVLLDVVPDATLPIAGGVMGSIPASVYEQNERETRHRCATASRYLYRMGLTYLDGRPWDSYVATGTAAEQILEAAKDSAADLIVMATHSRAGVDRLMHGSVAAHVLRHAAVPVLLLHVDKDAVQDAEPAAGVAIAGARARAMRGTAPAPHASAIRPR